MVTENPTMAMAMASTYTRWKRLVSGLAGGSSLKGEADFNLGVATTGEKHATRREHFRGALLQVRRSIRVRKSPQFGTVGGGSALATLLPASCGR